ncbi:S1/P1 nuclease [Thermomonas carbonis]|nr:S1/P1 nuclease [Thermomonas carbonis]GHC00101.1 endonuclease [Thermomonas carbonis]
MPVYPAGMANHRNLRLIAALLCLGAISTAAAWGRLGHGLVGELAQRHLDAKARAEVAALLAGEPDPTLAGVASWADDLRDNDPQRFKATSRWHYINAEGGGCGFELARDCPDDNCVVGAIEAQRAILADRSQPIEARRDALKFIVHFIGDAHQPMHAGSRTDSGGNGFQISLRTPIEPEAYARSKYVDGVMGTNLHSVWDYYILAGRGLGLQAYSDKLDALPWPPTPAPSTHDFMPLAWTGESCRLIDARGIYPPDDRHAMDSAYLDAMRPLAEQRVRQAAWRLAQLLNQTLGDAGTP